jgi:hypothetical protein
METSENRILPVLLTKAEPKHSTEKLRETEFFFQYRVLLI